VRESMRVNCRSLNEPVVNRCHRRRYDGRTRCHRRQRTARNRCLPWHSRGTRAQRRWEDRRDQRDRETATNCRRRHTSTVCRRRPETLWYYDVDRMSTKCHVYDVLEVGSLCRFDSTVAWTDRQHLSCVTRTTF